MPDQRVAFGRPAWRRWVTGLVMAGLLAVIVAGVAGAPASHPDRADALASRLRCPVCQGISVAESRSDTAVAMQDRIRAMVAQGSTDAEVMDWFTDRYGPWVRLDTGGSNLGLLLWVLPVVVGGVGVVIVTRRRRASDPTGADPAARARIRDQVARHRLLGEGDEA